MGKISTTPSFCWLGCFLSCGIWISDRSRQKWKPSRLGGLFLCTYPQVYAHCALQVCITVDFGAKVAKAKWMNWLYRKWASTYHCWHFFFSKYGMGHPTHDTGLTSLTDCSIYVPKPVSCLWNLTLGWPFHNLFESTNVISEYRTPASENNNVHVENRLDFFSRVPCSSFCQMIEWWSTMGGGF